MLPAWPAALDGLRVGVLTDLHAGMPHAGLDAVERAAEALTAERPDLVCLLGRLHRPPGGVRAAGRRRGAGGAARAAAAAPRGVVAVLGNHDWYAGARRIADALAGRRASPCSRTPRRRPATACGSPGWATTGSAARACSRALMPACRTTRRRCCSPTIPTSFPFVPARVALTLSGHTHGGQVGDPAACGGRSCPRTTASATSTATSSRAAAISTSPRASARAGSRCGCCGRPRSSS